MIGRKVAGRKILLFFIVTYGLSWIFWVPAAVFGHDFTSSVWLIPFILGGFGPSVAGIIMTYREHDGPGRRVFWERVIDFRRISGPWYAVIFLTFPAALTAAVLFNYLIQGRQPSFEVLNQFIANPLALIGAVVIGIFTGPLSEELGWRGYVQDQLQQKWSPLFSSLILAPFWWAWHLPLFFMSGTTHYNWGVDTLHFWLFMAGTFPLSVLLAWVYKHNNRSILAAVLLHFMGNFSLSLVHPMSETLHTVYVLLLALAALGTVLFPVLGKRRWQPEYSNRSIF